MLEALTYGLMLKPQLLTVTMKVMQILGEVLTMTEADDLDPGRNAIPALYNSLPGSRSTHTGFPSKTGVRDMQSPSELPHVVQVRCGVVVDGFVRLKTLQNSAGRSHVSPGSNTSRTFFVATTCGIVL